MACLALQSGKGLNKRLLRFALIPSTSINSSRPLPVLSLGDNITLTCTVKDTPTFIIAYSWSLNGIPLSGESMSTLVIPDVQEQILGI